MHPAPAVSPRRAGASAGPAAGLFAAALLLGLYVCLYLRLAPCAPSCWAEAGFFAAALLPGVFPCLRFALTAWLAGAGAGAAVFFAAALPLGAPLPVRSPAGTPDMVRGANTGLASTVQLAVVAAPCVREPQLERPPCMHLPVYVHMSRHGPGAFEVYVRAPQLDAGGGFLCVVPTRCARAPWGGACVRQPGASMRVRVRSPQTGGACGVGLHAEQGVQGVLRGRGGAIGAEFCAAKCQHSQAEMRMSRVATHSIPRHYFP